MCSSRGQRKLRCREQGLDRSTHRPRSEHTKERLVRAPLSPTHPTYPADARLLPSFIKMLSTATAGGTVINYSDRFSLSGMTGIFPPALLTDLKSVSDTKGPAAQNQVAGAGADAAAGAGDPLYKVPYTMQTGAVRYAPMQPLPPSKITADKMSRLHPTSAFSIATAYLKAPTVSTTMTQSITYAVTSRENDVGLPYPISLYQVELCNRTDKSTRAIGCSSCASYGSYGKVPESVEGLKCPRFLCTFDRDSVCLSSLSLMEHLPALVQS